MQGYLNCKHKGKYNQKFCSRKCYNEWQSNYKKEKNNPVWKPKIEKICKYCKNKYYIKPSLKGTSKFCSLDCRNKWQSEAMKGNDFRKK